MKKVISEVNNTVLVDLYQSIKKDFKQKKNEKHEQKYNDNDVKQLLESELDRRWFSDIVMLKGFIT